MGISPPAFIQIPNPTTPGTVPVADPATGTAVWSPPPLPDHGLEGLQLSWQSATEIRIYHGRCRDTNNEYDMVVPMFLTVSITGTGANGRDVGAEQNEWYDVYVIDGDDVPVAGLLVLLLDTPVLPAGYTRRRRVGAIRNDTDIQRFVVTGWGTTKTVMWLEPIASRQVLAAGSATTPTLVNMQDWVSINSQHAFLTVTQNLSTRPVNLYQTTSGEILDIVAGGETRSLVFPTDSINRIAYENGAGSGTGNVDIYVRGYTEDLEVLINE